MFGRVIGGSDCKLISFDRTHRSNNEVVSVKFCILRSRSLRGRQGGSRVSLIQELSVFLRSFLLFQTLGICEASNA